jgi:hypothetical protein
MQVIQTLSVLLAAMLTLSTSLAAQRRPSGTPVEETVATTIALSVGGVAYNFSGQAMCEHVPQGSIYDTVAERWSVRQQDNGRNLSLNLWHPLSGGADMVTMSVSTAGKRHDVDTVKKPQSNQTTGSATVKFVPQGKGGTITIDATAGSGAKISGTIKCDAFTAVTPVAG